MGPSGLSRYKRLAACVNSRFACVPLWKSNTKKTGRRDGVHFAFDNIANGLKSWLTSLTK